MSARCWRIRCGCWPGPNPRQARSPAGARYVPPGRGGAVVVAHHRRVRGLTARRPGQRAGHRYALAGGPDTAGAENDVRIAGGVEAAGRAQACVAPRVVRVNGCHGHGDGAADRAVRGDGAVSGQCPHACLLACRTGHARLARSADGVLFCQYDDAAPPDVRRRPDTSVRCVVGMTRTAASKGAAGMSTPSGPPGGRPAPDPHMWVIRNPDKLRPWTPR